MKKKKKTRTIQSQGGRQLDIKGLRLIRLGKLNGFMFLQLSEAASLFQVEVVL